MAPDSADALIHASLWRALTGDTMEARASTAHALELDPLSVEIGTLAGQVLFRLRDYDNAIEQLQRTLETDPNLPRAYGMLFRVYAAKRMNAEAVAAYQKVIELNGSTPLEVAAPGIAFANGGIRGFWLWRLQNLHEATRKGSDSPTERARLYALLGDNERVLELLEKAYQQRDYTVYVANVGYEFDSLHSDPRFQDLLRRMRLSQ
jgi:tetratricopeptide (TPR) repeat protein